MVPWSEMILSATSNPELLRAQQPARYFERTCAHAREHGAATGIPCGSRAHILATAKLFHVWHRLGGRHFILHFCGQIVMC